MPRANREWTTAKFERYRKERRGEGNGENYTPWNKIQELHSTGRVSRSPSWKTNRVHHLFDDREIDLFFLFEWSDSIIDIKEQFPLIDLDLAMKIATDMGIEYPKDAKSGTPNVLATTFMLVVKEGDQIVEKARTFKQVKDLGTKVAEILELEKRYFTAKGIDWGIITEKEVPTLLVENIEWIHSSYKLEATAEMSEEELRHVSGVLKSKLNTIDSTINKIATSLDKDMNLDDGTCLSLFKHLLARKEIIMDMRSRKVSGFLSTKDIQKIVF